MGPLSRRAKPNPKWGTPSQKGGGVGPRTETRKISKIFICRRDLVLTSCKAQGGAVDEVAKHLRFATLALQSQL